MAACSGPAEPWEKTVRNLHRPEQRERLQEYLRSSMRLSDEKYILPVEAKPFISTCQRIVRGLYWHEFRDRLPLEVAVDANLVSEIDGITTGMARKDVADGQFIYYFFHLPKEPTVSIWCLIFHKVIRVFLRTNPRRIDEVISSTGRE